MARVARVIKGGRYNAHMKLLALDTSTEYLSLAVWRDDVVSTREVRAEQQHTQLILPLLRELLDESGLRLPDLDAVAFGEGPGSFTGLRIGCGVAQGLAFGAGLPVVGVNTLLALAQQAPGERAIVCLDARMGEVYHAAYVKTNGDWQEVYAAGLYAPDAAPCVEGGGWYGIGNGWAAYADPLIQRYSDAVSAVIADVYPHARDIAHLAAMQLKQHGARPAREASPVYVRNKVALKTSER
jgi:tRNA threonylcarbamoyladenosine biosynthesis protein TsaB